MGTQMERGEVGVEEVEKDFVGSQVLSPFAPVQMDQ